MSRAFFLVIAIALGLGVLAVDARPAHAYPQYQLSHDQTCTGCHIAAGGGGLLNENGFMVSETMSQLGTNPEFLNGALGLPSWLVLGGEFRSQTGYIRTPEDSLTFFPMQAELSATVKLPRGFTVHAKAGYPGTEPPPVLSREHYVQWQQNPDEGTGVFVRLGRFMPTFGLRTAEHPQYVRRHGGTPLWGERYGVGVSYIDPKFEVHASGFIEEPLLDPVVFGNGASLYGEYRIAEKILVGAEGMYTKSDEDEKVRAGLIGKWYIDAASLLISGEGQFVRQKIAGVDASDSPLQLIANIIGTFTLTEFFQIDVGVGRFDSNLRVRDLERDAFEVNARYRLTSHFEMQLNTRWEVLAFGNGGADAGWALMQFHYRL